MTDPRRPEETDEFEAADAADDGLAGDELDDDDELDAEPHADELDADDLEETKELPAASVAVPAGAAAGARPTASRDKPAQGTTPLAPADELPYVDDRVSKLWVALIVLVFAAIFIYGLLLGRGGILTTSPSPQPIPSVPPSASPSPVRSPTLRPSVTAAPTGSLPPSASASPSVAPATTAPVPATTLPGPT